jgi:two-component system response regulator NreC
MSTRILLVDDHQIFRQGLRYMLEGEPEYEVVGEAAEGQEAIELFLKLEPDVVILDIEMPGMDGVETIRSINSNPKASTTKILVLSMHSERSYVSEMFLNGALGYVLKDSAMEELIVALQTIEKGKKYISPGLMDVVIEGFTSELDDNKELQIAKLTPKEKEIMAKLAEGLSTKEIAFMKSISIKTVDFHRRQIMQKLEIDNLAALVKLAIIEGLIELE